VPKVTASQNSFTTGEISPRLYGRTDLAKYGSAVKTMLNAYALPHGGFRRRPGLRYVATLPASFPGARLLRFVYTRDEAYVVVLYWDGSATRINVYTYGGRSLGYSFLTTWTHDEIASIRWTQYGDTMYLVHPNRPPHQLRRLLADRFSFGIVPFVQPPTDELGEWPNSLLSLSATSGAAVTATASNGCFALSDVGRYIEAGSARGIITGWTSGTVVTINTGTTTFDSISLPVETWRISESPKTTCTASAVGPIGASITLTLGAAGWKNLVGLSHVGYSVEINDGLVQITGYTSTTVVTGIVRTQLTALAAAPSGGWALRAPVWTFKPITRSYPRSVCAYQQRLFLASSDFFPATLWASVTGDFLDFSTGVGDDDAMQFTTSEQTAAIEHLVASRSIVGHTGGAELEVTGGIEKPIVPTNIQVKVQSAFGASTGRPVQVGQEILYVQRGSRAVRALSISDADYFNAPDVTILSEHITAPGILEMDYQALPDQVVWCLRTDGQMVPLTYNKEQQISAWAQTLTDGVVESIAVVPTGDSFRTFAIVKRTATGGAFRSLEFFDDTVGTDCTLFGTYWVNEANSALTNVTLAKPVVTAAPKEAGGTTTRCIVGAIPTDGVGWDRYFEVKLLSKSAGQRIIMGVLPQVIAGWAPGNAPGYTVGGVNSFGFSSDALRWNNGVSAAFGAAWNVGDVIGCRINLNANTVSFYLNGVLIGTPYTAISPTAGYVPAVAFTPGEGSVEFRLTAGQVQYTPVIEWGQPTTIWFGLTQCAGKTVQVVGNGKFYGSVVVDSAGEIELPDVVDEIYAGLPFSMTVTTLPTEIGTGTGTAQGNASSAHELIVRLSGSVGGQLDGDALPNQPVSSPPTVPTVYSGDWRMENLGWGRTGSGDSDGSITITHDVPFPFQCLALIKRMTVNDG
jgi:hypothetical protein